MIKLKPEELPTFRAAKMDNERNLWAVFDNGTQVTCLMSEPGARLLASVPALIKLLARMSRRSNAPAKVDIDRVLATCGLEIEHADEG